MKKAIHTKVLLATSTLPTRIKASDGDSNQLTVSVAMLTDDAHLDAAKALCRKMKWDGAETLVGGWLCSGEYAFVFTDSTPLPDETTCEWCKRRTLVER